MHLLTFFLLKVYNFAPKAGAASNIKPDVCQRKAMLRNDVGDFWRYIAEYSIAKFDVIQSGIALYSRVQ